MYDILILLPLDISKTILLKWYYPYIVEELKISLNIEDEYYIESFPGYSMVYQKKLLYEKDRHIFRTYVMTPKTMNIANRRLDFNYYIS